MNEIKNIKTVDLSQIYGLAPQSPACEILFSILKNYLINKVIVAINISPDTGEELYGEDEELKQMLRKITRDWKEGKKELQRLSEEYEIIELLDGYEYCLALIR